MSGLRYTGSDSSFLPWPSVSGSEWRESVAGKYDVRICLHKYYKNHRIYFGYEEKPNIYNKIRAILAFLEAYVWRGRVGEGNRGRG